MENTRKAFGLKKTTIVCICFLVLKKKHRKIVNRLFANPMASICNLLFQFIIRGCEVKEKSLKAGINVWPQ